MFNDLITFPDNIVPPLFEVDEASEVHVGRIQRRHRVAASGIQWLWASHESLGPGPAAAGAVDDMQVGPLWAPAERSESGSF